MIDKVSVEQCTLCGSCVNACPVGAISFKKEYLDFCYPEIDASRCVNCNLCEKSCPACQPQKKLSSTEPKAFAGKNPDVSVRKRSTSGGIFYALAQSILKQGGYVCGAVMDEAFHVSHQVSDAPETVEKMLGSKYVQSRTDQVFVEVKKLLDENKPVLFSGCPCQIAGIKAFLNKEYDNLFPAEVVCHGIPSQKMLNAYLSVQEKRTGAKAKSIAFRAKDLGWHSSAAKVEFENGKTYLEPITVDAYMYGFLGGITLKQSCYNCNFKNYQSGCDLILGDFWGAEAEMPELDDNTGLSAIVAVTQKGVTLLQESGIELHEVGLPTIVKYNKNIVQPTAVNPLRTEFYRYAEEAGYEKAIEKHFWESKIVRFKRITRLRIRRVKHLITGKKTLY